MSAVQYYKSMFTMIGDHLKGTLLPDEDLRGVANLSVFTGRPYCYALL